MTNTATKLFVLDTNVLMHDPSSLFRFAEHDIYIPMATLEELDNNKKGMSEVARNARQTSRYLDKIVSGAEQSIEQGISLKLHNGGNASGRLFLQTAAIDVERSALTSGKADNQIISVVRHLQAVQHVRPVILVSKDINMRIKAKALGLLTEDYSNDKVLEDTDILYAGSRELPAEFWDMHGDGMESWKKMGHDCFRVRGPFCSSFVQNEFVYDERGRSFYAIVREVSGETAVLETIKDYTRSKNSVLGVVARNREQNFALNALLDPNIDFVTLLGQAGTGKTLLTLASGLVQVLEKKTYSEIIMTRVTVPVGEDIGFLPGTEEEKMKPWMGALEDNLEVLNQTATGIDEGGKLVVGDLTRSHIKIKSLNFMRGRTFLKKYLIIDEAQNLTPKQMKTLVTRAGPGTKVVCLGNLAQIDTPYLAEGSSGLTYVVDRFKGWPHYGHITMLRGERSRLADHAVEVL